MSAPSVLHRPPPSWRSRHVFGALRLRQTIAQHSQTEAEVLRRYAAGAETVVELGVAEGGSAAELRQVMSPTGDLWLVDPYECGPLGVSMARVVARRTVASVRGARVNWVRARSDDAVDRWREPIDFLFIDADHSYERAASDWRLWTPFVQPGGYVALHDSVVFAGGWTGSRWGPVRLMAEIRTRETDWEVVAEADSLTVLQRRRSNGRNGYVQSGRSYLDRDDRPQTSLNILRVADVPGVATAGISGFMLSSSAEMGRRGHQVSLWFRDALAPSVSNPGLRRLLVPWLILLKVIAAVRRGERYDIIEIHEPRSAPYALLARVLRSRLPACVVISYGLERRLWQAERAQLRNHGRKPRLSSRILVPVTLLSQARVGLSAADAVLVPSSEDRDHLTGELGLSAERVSCAFTGVSEDLFELQRVTRDTLRVLFLGTWIERKGTRELIAAWRRLVTDRPHVRLTVAGVADAERARADTHDLPGVDIIPRLEREALPGLLTDHDIFVLPSSFEGMPLSMLEAAASGLPCVVSSVCGNLDVFRREDPTADGAILVPPHDAGALYQALLTLVDAAELRRVLGARARDRARCFTWAANAEQSLAAYSAAIQRRVAR